jgi:hypothetical protein
MPAGGMAVPPQACRLKSAYALHTHWLSMCPGVAATIPAARPRTFRMKGVSAHAVLARSRAVTPALEESGPPVPHSPGTVRPRGWSMFCGFPETRHIHHWKARSFTTTTPPIHCCSHPPLLLCPHAHLFSSPPHLPALLLCPFSSLSCRCSTSVLSSLARIIQGPCTFPVPQRV